MNIDRIELRLVNMRLTAPFETSFGVEQDRACVIVAVYAGDLIGWGECPLNITLTGVQSIRSGFPPSRE